MSFLDIVDTAFKLGGNILQGSSAYNARKEQGAYARRSHQIAVADMEAAGLNPILAAGNGAAVPGGQSYTGSMDTDLGGRDRESKLKSAQLRLLEEQIRAAAAQAGATSAQHQKTISETRLTDAELKLLPQKLGILESQARLNTANASSIEQGLPKRELMGGLYGMAQQGVNNARSWADSAIRKAAEAWVKFSSEFPDTNPERPAYWDGKFNRWRR